jgi:hypothetical protein
LHRNSKPIDENITSWPAILTSPPPQKLDEWVIPLKDKTIKELEDKKVWPFFSFFVPSLLFFLLTISTALDSDFCQVLAKTR